MAHPDRPHVRITTAGELHGPPPPADLTLSLRRFRDPHLDPELRERTATDPDVRHRVLSTPGVAELLNAVHAAIRAYQTGPPAGPLAVTLYCAGGRHRAPTIGAELAHRIRHQDDVHVTLTHRDIDCPVIHRPPSTSTRTKATPPPVDA